jgi:hypothetical protein
VLERRHVDVAELVELYGRHGFDVLCVTDHVVRRDDPERCSDPEPATSACQSIHRSPWNGRIRRSKNGSALQFG